MVKIFSLGLYMGFLVFLYIAKSKGIFKMVADLNH